MKTFEKWYEGNYNSHQTFTHDTNDMKIAYEAGVNNALYPSWQDLAEEGEYLKAVMKYRKENNDCRLREAKEVVDNYLKK